MTPYHYALPEKAFTTSYIPSRYNQRQVRTLNETIRHALRKHNLKYHKTFESIHIRTDDDETNLALFRLEFAWAFA